jgi:hypothetical protein
MNRCIDCNRPIARTSKRCRWCANSKKNNPNWQGGLDEEKYKDDFTEDMRDRIRFRDHFTCQVCGKKQDKRFSVNKEFKLDIHHIDYNKLNSKSNNLVSVCHPCHIKTNYDRPKWIAFFYNLFKKRELL